LILNRTLTIVKTFIHYNTKNNKNCCYKKRFSSEAKNSHKRIGSRSSIPCLGRWACSAQRPPS